MRLASGSRPRSAAFRHGDLGMAATVARAGVLAGGIAAAVWLTGCSTHAAAAFQIRPVLKEQPGPCRDRHGVPGIGGGCYQLAGFGVAVAGAQDALALPYPAGGFIVEITLGPEYHQAVLRMMQPPPGALPAYGPGPGGHRYQAVTTLGIVQNGKVLCAFPALVGFGRQEPVMLQVNGLTRARADDLVHRLGM